MGATDDILGVIPTMVVGYGAIKMTDAMFGGNSGQRRKRRHTRGCCLVGSNQKINMTLPSHKIKMRFGK